jgi:hypothetical protein
MSSKLLLRIAAIIMLLHTIGHSMAAFSWKTDVPPVISQVILDMQSHHFNFMGRSVSMALFYEGYGFTMIFVLLMVAIWLWLLAGNTDTPLAYRMLLVLFLFLVTQSLIEFYYFFPFAAAFSFISAVLSGVALLKMRRRGILND